MRGRATRRGAKSSLKLRLLRCGVVVFFSVALILLSRSRGRSSISGLESQTQEVLIDQCSKLSLEKGSQGFILPPEESTILMLFSPHPNTSPSSTQKYCYDPWFKIDGEEGETVVKGTTERGESCLLQMRGNLQRSFQQVSAAFLSEPRGSSGSPFFDFFSAHGATFWEVSADGVAKPFQFDVVYTYVNPAAPSMKRNMEARGLGERTTERRYNDWDELRFSFRGLRKFMLDDNNVGLRQSTEQLAHDKIFLEGLGLTVPADTAMNTTLVRRIILLLAHEDQAPAWLDVEKFAGLEIVTHKAMFSAPNETFILPTLNSNAIESGIHRIPGLTNFYLYFNNDMFVTRKTSMFDLFRPLSPPRQELHFTSMVTKEGTSLKNVNNGGCRWPTQKRTLAFLEPHLHSYGNEMEYLWDKEEVKDQEKYLEKKGKIAATCLQLRAEETLKKIPDAGGRDVMSALTEVASVPGFDSRAALGFPYPFSIATRYGLGVDNGWYLSVMRNNINGFDGPSTLAHIPQVTHRLTAVGLNEFDFFPWVNATRTAAEREGFPFSTVDIYAGYAAGMVRARERYLWDRLMQLLRSEAAIEMGLTGVWMKSVEAFIEEHGMWNGEGAYRGPRGGTATIPQCGPLYGSPAQVRVQSPHLFEELAFWWLPSLRPKEVDGESIKALKKLYSIPAVAIYDGACPSSSVTFSGHPRLDEQYRMLYQDVRTHLGSDRTFHFEMLEGGVKPLAVLGGLRDEEKGGTIPVWYNLNDNYHETGDDTERAIHSGLFKILMTIISGRVGPAPWEIDAPTCK